MRRDGFTSLRRSAENGFTPLRRSGENGFTLVELMVALLIFGMLAASGVSLLNFSVRAQAASAQRLDAVANDRRMSALLAGDLAQVLPRTTRDSSGANIRAFAGTNGVGALPVLSYVRGGWSNPEDAPRASIQRVEIVLVDGSLERRTYPMTDGAVAGAPQILSASVEAISLRYRTRGAWTDSWTSAPPSALPAAVELTLKRRSEPALTMAFLVGTGT